MISASRTAKARLVASISPWIWSKLSPRLTFEPVEQAEDDERGEPLGRRRRVEQRAVVELERQRLAQPRLVAAEVVARHRTADRFEVGGDLGGDVAAIEVVKAGMGELVERVGETRLLPDGADLRRLALGEEVRGEARHILQRVDIARSSCATATGSPRTPSRAWRMASPRRSRRDRRPPRLAAASMATPSPTRRRQR